MCGSKNFVYCSALWQFLCIVANNADYFSALLPTTRKNVPLVAYISHLFFCVLGNNVEKCSNFSSCVFFSVVTHNADNFSASWIIALQNDQRYCLQHIKMVSVLGNNAEKCSNLNISKNTKRSLNSH